MKKIYGIGILVFLFNAFWSSAVFADEFGIGSDNAAPIIKELLESLPMEKNKIYVFTDSETEKLIAKAADIKINIFELLDCIYRYLAQNSFRAEIKGSSLQRLLEKFDFGKDRIPALLPIAKIEKMQTGAVFEENQHALDMYLKEPYEKYIEIGIAMYKTRFGFKKIEPNLFSQSFGMQVKKFGIKKAIEKIHLYENGKGAIYAKGFIKPKRWNLWLITRIEIEQEMQNGKK